MVTDNASKLQTISDGQRSLSAPMKDAPEGRKGSSTFTGNASATAFVVTHGLKDANGADQVPSNIQVTATTVVAGAAHAVTGKTATQFTITFAAAPAAATDNIKFDWIAYN